MKNLVSILEVCVEYIESRDEFDIIEEGVMMADEDDIRMIMIKAGTSIAALKLAKPDIVDRLKEEMLNLI